MSAELSAEFKATLEKTKLINIEVNIDVTLVTEGYVTFKQGKTVVEKTIKNGGTIS